MLGSISDSFDAVELLEHAKCIRHARVFPSQVSSSQSLHNAAAASRIGILYAEVLTEELTRAFDGS